MQGGKRPGILLSIPFSRAPGLEAGKEESRHLLMPWEGVQSTVLRAENFERQTLAQSQALASLTESQFPRL